MISRPDCHLFNTHFMTKLIGLTGSAEDKYMQVARWTRGINLAEKVAIVAPVFGADHWFLLVATDMSGSHPTVTVLNSIPGYGNEEQAAAAFIEYLWVACKVGTISLLQPQLPKQTTSNDCGAFVVLYHKHMMEDIEQFQVTRQLSFRFSSTFTQRRRDQDNLGEWFPQSAVLEERSRIAAVIRSHSPATAIFPNLSLPEEEVEEKAASNNRQERVSKKAAAFKLGNSNADEIIPIALFRWQTFTRPGSFL